MGDFSNANKWSIVDLKNIIIQQQDKIKYFEDNLQQQKSLSKSEYEKKLTFFYNNTKCNCNIFKFISNKKANSYKRYMQNKM
jgi:hypothetical protein